MLSGEENLVSNCVRCPRGEGCARRKVSKCYFPLFLGAGGFLCRGHHLPDGRHCAAESKTVVYGANLNLPCNYFLGKAVQAQLGSLFLPSDWSRSLFYCQHLLTPHLQGGCKASPLLNPVCLFCASFGGPGWEAGQWDRVSAAPGCARGSSLLHAAGLAALVQCCMLAFVSSSRSRLVSGGTRYCQAQSLPNLASQLLGFTSSP